MEGDIEGAATALATDQYLAAFGGALTANASTAFVQGAGMSGPNLSLGGLNAPGMSGPTTTTAAGAAAGSALATALTSVTTASNPEIPPDLADMYKNDPDTALQFARFRKAARALGRAGTIKSKGSSSLGMGDQVLGDQLSLVGS